ncbi:MAG TPA: hypothetical protein ENI51_00800 [Candidatus Atribacteria bacterium]|nr:hypothetical protein [Candidatus Atribacteria bacterium]
MSWGSKGKIYVSSENTKKIYDRLVKDYSQYFPSLSVLFQIAAAVGMFLEKKKKLDKNVELVNVYSIDKDSTFALLLEIMYPELTPEQRLEELEKFAEAGIEYILKEIETNGSFIIEKFIYKHLKDDSYD